MPQATNAIFGATELSAWLRQPVEDEAAWEVEEVVWGWLSTPLGLTERPETASPSLRSMAIELGAIAYANPEGLKSYRLESEWTVYSSERRDEILAQAAVGTGGALSPRGSFPTAPYYPDRADRSRW